MFIRIRTNTAEKTSFILKICPDDDAVRHHGLGEWLPLKRQAASRPRDKSLLHNVNELAPPCCGAIHIGARLISAVAINCRTEKWWSQTESNRRPQACKASALPTELWPRRNTHIIEARTDCKLPATSDAIHIVRKPSTDPARMNGGPGKS